MPNTESSANISGSGRSPVEDLPIAVASVTAGGQLLSYTDNGLPGNVGPASVIVGNGGWLQFQSLFAGANAINENHIYAVNDEGQLLSYTDNGAPGNVGPASVTVGADGWLQFKFLFAGRNEQPPFAVNVIYAVNQGGQLLSYNDDGGTSGDVSHPVVVGFGAWLEFQFLFAGANASGGNRIYAVTKPAGGGGGTSTPSLLAGVGELPQNPSNFGLRIEGNNFGANETVEVTVDWRVGSEEPAPVPIAPQTNSLGYFQVWFSGNGNTPDGLCPISVAEGQPQPPQYFSVSATGMTSHKTASATAGPFTCIT
jgi:hypothetical protein